uniref:Acid-sensing ion channel 1 n=1 Tax=Strongyloides papillosus TaxID=174720 RepID=A0A0N5B7K5_STREA
MPEIEYLESTSCDDKKENVNRRVENEKLQKSKDEICRCFVESDRYTPWVFEVHGLSQALLSKTLRRRVIFWLILLACASLCITMTTLVVSEYLNMQTATSTTIKVVPSLQIPAVTICPKVADALDFEGIYNDMKKSFTNMTIIESKRLLQYFLAGHGFENMDDVGGFNRSYLDYLDKQYTYWSRNYTTESFFNYIQDTYAIKCNEFFTSCQFDGSEMDCCNDLFRPMAVMRRGLCFQSREGLKQKEVDDLGKLSIRLKALPSASSFENQYQKQVIVFVTDNFNYVTTGQRYYLSPNVYNRIYLSARKIELLEHKNDCSSKIEGADAACIVRNWLHENVIALKNCTLTYLKDIPGVDDYPICNVSTIANFYFLTIQYTRSGGMGSSMCLPGCHRWEYFLTLQQGNALTSFSGFNFSLDVTYFSLQYQKITEVSTTTIPGFMSQIGGQFGFCLGFSIITIIQIFIYLQEHIFMFFFGLALTQKMKSIFKKIFIYRRKN